MYAQVVSVRTRFFMVFPLSIDILASHLIHELARGFPRQCVFSSTPQRYPEMALVRSMWPSAVWMRERRLAKVRQTGIKPRPAGLRGWVAFSLTNVRGCEPIN
jgi:hypothetical protein